MNASGTVLSPNRMRQRGSVLIIVMVICMGLVTLTLYFANSMSAELRAADNRVQETAARQAVAGGMRYANLILKTYAVGGAVPDPEVDYQSEELPVGEATFWFIGRDNDVVATTEPVFGLVDEAAKLNLNTASRAMLEALPGMSAEFAQAIIDWRSPAAARTGSADNNYAGLNPARLNKGAAFESVDELRLVNGTSLDLLFGEDTNRNGALDDNENDGELSPPRDNQDGVLQAGLLEFVTVFSRQPNTRSNGSPRVNITTPQQRAGLPALLRSAFSTERANALLANVGNANFSSVAEFMVASRMTADEFARVHTDITAGNGNSIAGLVNVNTASATVLACIPGIGTENAATLVAYRAAHKEELTSLAWIAGVLKRADLVRAGPFLTDQSYQFTADVAAVARNGRGYAREKTVFDLSNGSPRIIYHQDLGQYGWALGAAVRQNLSTPKDS